MLLIQIARYGWGRISIIPQHIRECNMGGYLVQRPLKNRQCCTLGSSNLPALIMYNKYLLKMLHAKPERGTTGNGTLVPKEIY
jgi:hypothetical protein